MLDEDRAGTVLKVQGEAVLVEWDDGFAQWMEASDLVKENGFIDPDMIGSPNASVKWAIRLQKKTDPATSALWSTCMPVRFSSAPAV